MTDQQTIKIPRGFFEDHNDRDCHSPDVVRSLSHHYIVDATPCIGLLDLYTDADYYSNPAYFERQFFGLCSSARATKDAIEKALGAEGMEALLNIEWSEPAVPGDQA